MNNISDNSDPRKFKDGFGTLILYCIMGNTLSSFLPILSKNRFYKSIMLYSMVAIASNIKKIFQYHCTISYFSMVIAQHEKKILVSNKQF